MRVVVLVAEGVEDLEYWVIVMRLREAGAAVTSVGTSLEPVAGKHGLRAEPTSWPTRSTRTRSMASS